MNKLTVKCTLTEEALGMTAPTKELLARFIELQKKRLEKKASIISADKEKEELESVNLQIKQMENDGRGYTVFPRDVDGTPIFWDYQIKGFFKDAFKALLESDDEEFVKTKCGFSKWTSDRVVDQLIFPGPRKIKIVLPEGGVMGQCDRPLRTKDNHGVERNALASSETVPAGSEITFTITYLKHTLKPQIIKALEYGALRGFAQWRNSGKGRFIFEVIEDK